MTVPVVGPATRLAVVVITSAAMHTVRASAGMMVTATAVVVVALSGGVGDGAAELSPMAVASHSLEQSPSLLPPTGGWHRGYGGGGSSLAVGALVADAPLVLEWSPAWCLAPAISA